MTTRPVPVVVHGHLYQPPRDDPWTGRTAEEPTAAPYHDWNERITDECYRPNARAQVHAADGTIAEHNNYTTLSFNVAPTLAAWLDDHDPSLLAALRRADEAQMARTGHGGAIAHPYVHAILPLCSPADRSTLVLWGIVDFVARFGRAPLGMWLPETALDVASLETLAAHDIAFTIVAPYQVVADTAGVPVEVALPSGRSITLLPYDGDLSSYVAFGGALHNGVTFAERIIADAAPRATAAIVTDMESYGHHHRFGEMALAVAFDELAANEGVVVTNAAGAIALTPPVDGIAVAPSAWSCQHGVERWRSDCGCRAGAETPHGQRWRAPMRTALDRLRDAVVQLPALSSDLDDSVAARDAYATVLLDAATWPAFSARHVRAAGDSDRARGWLELQRHLLFMYSSCGWFFDDAAGHEALISLRHARRAVEVVVELGGPDLDRVVGEALAPMHSDLYNLDGRAIWNDLTRRDSHVPHPS